MSWYSHVLLVSIAVYALMIIEPGSDYLLVFRLATRSRQAGQLGAIGIGLGALVLATLSIVGVARVLGAPSAFSSMLRIIGAIWLVWQAAQVLLGGSSTTGLASRLQVDPVTQGAANHVINAELLLFYAALFATIRRVAAFRGEEILLGLAMGLFTTAWFVGVATFVNTFARFRRVLNSPWGRGLMALSLAASAAWMVLG